MFEKETYSPGTANWHVLDSAALGSKFSSKIFIIKFSIFLTNKLFKYLGMVLTLCFELA